MLAVGAKFTSPTRRGEVYEPTFVGAKLANHRRGELCEPERKQKWEFTKNLSKEA